MIKVRKTKHQLARVPNFFFRADGTPRFHKPEPPARPKLKKPKPVEVKSRWRRDSSDPPW
jgi:hypothetical protein